MHSGPGIFPYLYQSKDFTNSKTTRRLLESQQFVAYHSFNKPRRCCCFFFIQHYFNYSQLILFGIFILKGSSKKTFLKNTYLNQVNSNDNWAISKPRFRQQISSPTFSLDKDLFLFGYATSSSYTTPIILSLSRKC